MAADTETVEVREGRYTGVVADRYSPIRLLGRGGSKEVYLAWDMRLEREIALSLLVTSADPVAVRARLLRESQLMARLGHHPHIVTVHEFGYHAGVPFLVAQHMEGGSLAARLARTPGRRLPWSAAVTVAAEVADALACAHAADVVHRDVKPDNIWLDGRGAAALGDFGIAQVGRVEGPSRSPGLVGTALYLSPEQAQGLAVDPRADLYALGITLYELIAGRPPFEGADPFAVAQRHVDEAPLRLSSVRPEIPPALDELVCALLAKAPDERPESAAAVHERLCALAARAGTLAPDDPAGELVGREDVLARLDAACAAALETGPAVVAIAGEPGAGKTRIAETLGTCAASRGAAVHWARCLEGSAVQAYLPWRQLLPGLLATAGLPADVRGRLDPLLGDSEAEAVREQLFEAIERLVVTAAEQQPLVLVIDNLQWTDRTSLELLRYVVTNVPRAPLVFLVTYRPSAVGDPEQPVEALLDELGCRGVELEGLDRASIERIAGLVTGRTVPQWLVTALHARTRGNPYFVNEVARGLARRPALALGRRGMEQFAALIPHGVRELVRARMARLSRGAREIVWLAAVAGETFDPTVVARASGRPRPEVWDALDEARRVGLVEETPEGHRFSHGIVRDVVYREDVPAATRAAMHRAVAEVLERGSGHQPAELARHLLIAARHDGDAEAAVHHCEEAGRRAGELQAHSEAAGLYADALEALDMMRRVDLLRRARLLLARAEALTAAGDIEDGHPPFEEAAALARDLGATELFARAAMGRAAWQHYGIVDWPAIDLLREALELVSAHDSAVRAALLGRLALRLDADEDQLSREALLDEAIAMATRIDDRDVLVALHGITPLVNWRPERTEARRAGAAEAIRLATETGDAGVALWAQISLFCDHLDAGDVEVAEAELDAYGDLATRARLGWHARYRLVMRATLATFQGDLARSRRLVDEAQELDREQGDDAGQEFCVQRLVLAKLIGRPEDAEAELLRTFAGRYTLRPLWQALLALLELELGRPAPARRALAACVPNGPRALPSNRDTLGTLAILGEVAARLGDVGWAADVYDLLLPHADRNPVTDHGWAAWGAVARPLGLLAARLGAEEPAREHFAQAIRLHARWGARPWLLHTIADMLECVPDARRDDALVRRGLQLAREIGAAPLERRLVRLWH